MKRLAIYAGLALCCAAIVGSGRGFRGAAQAASTQKPNIIVILADDLGYADISAYGIHRIDTPNIDSIGNNGIKFTDGYASAPVCAPSRAGLQTGRYQERFGFEFNSGPALRDMALGLGLAVGEITLADELRKNGYHTGAIGKWHLGNQDQFCPTNRGYDESLGSCRARLPTSIPVCRAFISGTREAWRTPMRPASVPDDVCEGLCHRLSRGRTGPWCITNRST